MGRAGRLALWVARCVRRAACVMAALTLSVLPLAGVAQEIGTVQSQILVLDPDRLFMGTLVGQRLTLQYQQERDNLIAQNRKIEADLRAEEQALTDARPTMTPSAFRDKADAFDARVRGLRIENERAARDLERGREIAPLTLMRMAEPILVQVMRDAGGAIILDNRQVLLRADVIDITDLAISRIDEAIGDGSGQQPPDVEMPIPENVPENAPETAPMPAPMPEPTVEPTVQSMQDPPGPSE